MHPIASRPVLPLVLACALAAAADPVSWTPLYEPGCGGWIVDVVPSPHDPQRILITGDMLGVGLSTDGGDS